MHHHISLKHLVIDGKKQIGIQYKPTKLVANLLKGIEGVKYSEEFGLAYVRNTKLNFQLIMETFKGVVWIDMKYFLGKASGQQEEIQSMRDLRNRVLPKNWRRCPQVMIEKLELKRYSIRTGEVYVNCFERFINHYKKMALWAIGEEEIRAFILQLQHEGYSDSSVNQHINAIKFYYEVVMGMPNRFYSIERPKKKKKLPVILSKSEVHQMMCVTTNLKHRCVLGLLYSSGLRRNELLHLKIEDVDSDRMMLHVRDAKGGKDRMTLLSEKLLKELRLYYKYFKPKEFLIEGKYGGMYTGASVLNIVKQAAKRAGIKKNVSPHTLRHSFATHLLEDGVDLRYIQVLLGHNSSRTTEIYTHVANKQLGFIRNPFDSLSLVST
ncbi:MAG: site-specific integrase [Vicingaceae bacterium]